MRPKLGDALLLALPLAPRGWRKLGHLSKSLLAPGVPGILATAEQQIRLAGHSHAIHRGGGPSKRWPTGLTLSTCCADDTNSSIMTGWWLRSGAPSFRPMCGVGARWSQDHRAFVRTGCLKPGAAPSLAGAIA